MELFASDIETFSHATEFEGLPPLRLRFFTPRLAEKPQDPIMDALNREQNLKLASLRASETLPLDSVISANQPLPPLAAPTDDDDGFWCQVRQASSGGQVCSMA